MEKTKLKYVLQPNEKIRDKWLSMGGEDFKLASKVADSHAEMTNQQLNDWYKYVSKKINGQVETKGHSHVQKLERLRDITVEFIKTIQS